MLGFLKSIIKNIEELFFNKNYNFEYEAGAGRPPIFPPNREYATFGETRYSKARRKAYLEYLKKYDEVLKKGDFKPVV